MNSTYKNIVEQCGTPTFAYSEETLLNNIRRVKKAVSVAGLEERVKIYVAYFANSNPHLFRILTESGVGITLQSIEEWHQLEQFGLEDSDITVSPTALSDDDLDFFVDKKVKINVALPEELEHCLQRTDKVGIRIDLSPEQNQRTGIKIPEFEKIRRICSKSGKDLYAIHTYPGTGSNLDRLTYHAKDCIKTFHQFSGIKEINLGGGFAFDYESTDAEEKHFPWNEYFLELDRLIKLYGIPEDIKISIEPGRDLLADAGELIVKINRVHGRPHDGVQRIFTDGSYVYMPSATIRERQHQLRFLDEHFDEMEETQVYGELSGCTTLSRDYLFPGIVRVPTKLSKGCYIIVRDVGAYGACEHLEFLNKRPASEVLIRKGGSIELITERGGYIDRLRYTLERPIRI